MASDVLSKLDGTHHNFVRFEIPDKPSKIIILGTLGDKSKDFSSRFSDTERTLTSVKNNSLSVKFLVKKTSEVLRVKPILSVYYRVYPTFEEQCKYVNKNYEENSERVDVARIWKRMDCIFTSIKFDLSEISIEETLDFSEYIDAIKSDNEIYVGGKEISSECLENDYLYSNKIQKVKTGRIPPLDWKCRVCTQIEDFVQNKEKLKLVTVTMINDTEENKKYETFLFNCNLKIDLDDIELVPFRYEYEYEGYNYHYENFLRCLNCHADYDGNKIMTKHFAKFSQKKIVPRSLIDTLSLHFEDLSSQKKNLKLLEELYKKMLDYLKSYKKSTKYLNDERKYKKDVAHFEEIAERFHEGIETLKNNENARKAFELLNKTFRKASKYEKWWIFQIIFIVSLIPDIIDKTRRREICEILHVATGGGKSEAYFGCVIFSAFWDRLSGKKFGTTAITKFPLRMLSIQQLQRIANLLIWAEEIRKEEHIEGEPFSVAYFVGSTDEFPRHSKKLIDNLKKARTKGIEVPGKIVNICPICKGKVILDYKDNERYIIHKCEACQREFRLFFTDEEIYRFLPTFIVSTVDKLAGIATNRRFKNIFGGKINECPKGHGFLPHNDTCEVETEERRCGEKGNITSIDFKTGPTLVVQDEMHLIRGGFGTINSHFESLIEILQKELCGYGFKNIAMTATITGAKEQIEHLYYKGINIFPGDPPEEREKNNFFFEYELDESNNAVVQRQLIGLKPNFRDNQYASLLTLKYISEFINYVESNIAEFSLRNGLNVKELEKMTESYKNILTYHSKKSDVHSMNYYLEAVVNSKLDKYKIKPKILTGDNTLDDIKELIDLIDKYFDDAANKESLLSVFATSMVSHGIDIDKWNIMAFQGVPRSIAEYIQALSRVGRKYPGLVFVWFYPNRARDLSFYQNFLDYHKVLEHKVEEIPLSRWAKLGFKQTFTSIFSASILNYFSDMIGEPIYTVDKVNEVFATKENREKLIEFIKKAYISVSSMIGADYFKDTIPKETEERLNYLATYTGGERNFFPNALKDTPSKYYRTQYGMRGIQDEVILKPSDYDVDFLRKAMG